LQSLRQDLISEQAFGLTLDNGLLVADVTAGGPLESAELMGLVAGMTALYLSVTLESRTLGSVDKCHRLWSQAARLFSKLCDSWTGIESGEQSVAWLRGRLEHYRSLCLDRCELYRVTEIERQVYAKRKASDSDSEYSFGTRGEIAAH
jgi:hypothetical protein